MKPRVYMHERDLREFECVKCGEALVFRGTTTLSVIKAALEGHQCKPTALVVRQAASLSTQQGA